MSHCDQISDLSPLGCHWRALPVLQTAKPQHSGTMLSHVLLPQPCSASGPEPLRHNRKASPLEMKMFLKSTLPRASTSWHQAPHVTTPRRTPFCFRLKFNSLRVHCAPRAPGYKPQVSADFLPAEVLGPSSEPSSPYHVSLRHSRSPRGRPAAVTLRSGR